MKNLIVLLIPIMVSGCASVVELIQSDYERDFIKTTLERQQKEKEEADKNSSERKAWLDKEYLGKELYLKRGCYARSQLDVETRVKYIPFEKAKIEEVNTYGGLYTASAYLKLSQDGKTFFFTKVYLGSKTAFEECLSKTDPLKGLTKQEKEDVINSNWRVGMRAEVLKLIQGEPNKINTTYNKHILFQQYVYGSTLYFYFSNNKLTSWQISN